MGAEKSNIPWRVSQDIGPVVRRLEIKAKPQVRVIHMVRVLRVGDGFAIITPGGEKWRCEPDPGHV